MTININDLTIGQARQLASIMNATYSTDAAVGGEAAQSPGSNHPSCIDAHFIGKKAIIRTYSAGVWFGTVAEKDGNEIIITDARRLWYWKAAKSISLSAVANFGVDQKVSKITAPVSSVWLEAIEIIPATDDAIKSIEGAPHVDAQ